jgi:hypothetical protein
MVSPLTAWERWKARHPARARKLAREASARWRARHPERARAVARRWYAKHRNAKIAQVRALQKSLRVRGKQLQRRRRMSLRGEDE